MGTIRIAWGNDARTSRFAPNANASETAARPKFLGLTTMALIIGAIGYGFYLVRSYTESRRNATPAGSQTTLDDDMNGWNPAIPGPLRPADAPTGEIADFALYPRTQPNAPSGLQTIINLIASADAHIIGCLPDSPPPPPIVAALSQAAARGIVIRVVSRAQNMPPLTPSDQPLPPMFIAVDGLCAAISSEPLRPPSAMPSTRRAIVATVVSPALTRQLETLVGDMMSQRAPAMAIRRSVNNEPIYERDGDLVVAMLISATEANTVVLDAIASERDRLTVFHGSGVETATRRYLGAISARGTAIRTLNVATDASYESAGVFCLTSPSTIVIRAMGDPSAPGITLAFYQHPLAAWIQTAYAR